MSNALHKEPCSIPDEGDPIRSLIKLMTILRDPEKGCPWDLKQTWNSLIPYTLEEAYEVADAVQRQESRAIQEELGDLLLQVIFYSQLAEEEGAFTFNDVAATCFDKMVRRHPHVFEHADIKTAEEQEASWERIKQQERLHAGSSGVSSSTGSTEESTLDGLTNGLPALIRAMKLQKKAAQIGFDWENALDVLEKVKEEVHEVQHELQHATLTPDASDERLCDEIGDLFFSVVNLARKSKIDPELALRAANVKFERRFRSLEKHLKTIGKNPKSAGIAELERAWAFVKKQNPGL